MVIIFCNKMNMVGLIPYGQKKTKNYSGRIKELVRKTVYLGR